MLDSKTIASIRRDAIDDLSAAEVVDLMTHHVNNVDYVQIDTMRETLTGMLDDLQRIESDRRHNIELAKYNAKRRDLADSADGIDWPKTESLA